MATPKPPSSRCCSSRDCYHHGHLRNALIDAAVRLVAERGVEGFSLREAARELGVSPAAAYRHFADKSTLLAAVAADGARRLAAGMEKAFAQAPGAPGSATRAAAAFVAMGEAYIEFAIHHPSHFRVMFGPYCDRAAKERLRAEMGPGERDPHQILVDSLDELVASGAIRAEAREGAEVVAWSSVHGLASLLVDEVVPSPASQRAAVFRPIARNLLAGLGCRPSLLGPRPAPVDADPHRSARKGRRSR